MIAAGVDVQKICNICYEQNPTFRCRTCTYIVCVECMSKLVSQKCPQCRNMSRAGPPPQPWHYNIDVVGKIVHHENPSVEDSQVPELVLHNTGMSCCNISYPEEGTLTHRLLHAFIHKLQCMATSIIMIGVTMGIGALMYVITGQAHIFDSPKDTFGIILVMMMMFIAGLICEYVTFFCSVGCCVACAPRRHIIRV